MLLDLQAKFDGTKVEFENQVTIPTLLRLIQELDKGDFKTACKRLKRWGIEKGVRRALYRFVEGMDDAPGEALGEAARIYIWPEDDESQPSLKKLARQFDVSLRDLKFIVVATEKLQDELG
jgi:hypothetical protein